MLERRLGFICPTNTARGVDDVGHFWRRIPALHENNWSTTAKNRPMTSRLDLGSQTSCGQRVLFRQTRWQGSLSDRDVLVRKRVATVVVTQAGR